MIGQRQSSSQRSIPRTLENIPNILFSQPVNVLLEKDKKKKKENKAVATFGVVFLQVLWQTTYTGGRTVGQTERWKDRQKDKRSHGRLPYVSSCFSFNV